MATYKTQQKKDLTDFLKAHSDRALTIDEIVENMKADPAFENAPGRSTVYRLMSKLVEEGSVTCFSKGGGSKAAYQIMGGEHCHHHMHMKCTGCGRLLHMSDEDSCKLLAQIKSLNNFDIDLSQTLLFGRCQGCLEGGKGGAI